MIKKLRTTIKILYIKWILGQCHGICRKCNAKNQCYDNFEL